MVKFALLKSVVELSEVVILIFAVVVATEGTVQL